jgi:hypothetical protein
MQSASLGGDGVLKSRTGVMKARALSLVAALIEASGVAQPPI